MYIDVLFELPFEQAFTYKVPKQFCDKILLYIRVKAPFKNSHKTGIIIKIYDDCFDPEALSYELKEIICIIDEFQVIDENSYKLASWIKDYYLCSTGEAVFTILPKEFKEKTDLVKVNKIHELFSLSEEQQNAFIQVKNAINKERFEPFLLFGYTGTGKTEVYRHIAAYCKEKGKVSLILVPEISLTPQTVKRFSDIFGDRIAVIHSRLNPKEKLYHWRRIMRNEIDVILGARSAIFAPVKNPGAIIIDEEHEATYKSQNTPKYNAKQIAYYLAKVNKIPLILGSATPQIETYYHSENGNFNILKLTKKFSTEQKNKILVIDMKGIKGIFHPLLIEKVIEKLNKREQVILFLNRRGFSPYICCASCGNIVNCKHCSVSMTFHKKKNVSICHLCGITEKIPEKCPLCGSKELTFMGSGTEKIEEILESTFPFAKIARMDFDSTRGKHGHEKLFNALGKGEIDILIGTQMVAKGIHFPNVTFVGVIDADIALNLPDFRASERAFSLLTQVAGRAGRGEIKGEVIIQTRLPGHYVIDLARQNDYESFYKKEIEIRKKTGFPPFSRLIRLVLRGKNEGKVSKLLFKILEKINIPVGIEILGPAECPISKVSKYHRWHLILRGQDLNKMKKTAIEIKEQLVSEKSVYLEVDVDPLTML